MKGYQIGLALRSLDSLRGYDAGRGRRCQAQSHARPSRGSVDFAYVDADDRPTNVHIRKTYNEDDEMKG